MTLLGSVPFDQCELALAALAGAIMLGVIIGLTVAVIVVKVDRYSRAKNDQPRNQK
jgi:hypothetical protein